MDADTLSDLVAAVRDFIRTAVVPLEEQIDAEDTIPARIVEQCKQMGLYGFTIPEEFGGLGLSAAEEVELVMELGWTTPALRSLFGTNNGIAGHVLLEGATEAQRKEWLPQLADGRVTASFGLTEADAGSDPSSLTTRARRDGGDWVVNGAKRYITNAPDADIFMIFARTDPDAPGTRGISTFLVPRDTPGLTVPPADKKMGQFGAHTADVVLEDVRVPAERVIGGEDGVEDAS